MIGVEYVASEGRVIQKHRTIGEGLPLFQKVLWEGQVFFSQ